MFSRRHFLRNVTLGTGALFLPTAPLVWGRETFHLPRSTPESEGVASSAIEALIDALGAKHEMHSIVIARRGKVIAEGWWAPYAPELRHTMYSMSKSFTSTAVGFAVAEGKLTVEDKVTSFFPDALPAKISENLAALRVKHLLTMSVGSEKEPTFPMVQQEDWVRFFLAHDISHEPGSVFMYNSAATYMCSAIVQKLTGQKIVDYLAPRLFEPLGIDDPRWEICPRGICTGGWGLSVPTEALAKFGTLFLQRGKWNGKQLLPAAWVDEATAFHIQQPPVAKPSRPKELNDWQQGYGYQFWRCQHGGFRGDGAFGQFTIVLPEQETVIAMTSETGAMQGQLDLVWEHLFPALKSQPLAEDKAASDKLRAKLAALALPVPKGSDSSPTMDAINGKTFTLAENSLGLKTFHFNSLKHGLVLTANDGTEHSIVHTLGGWKLGQTTAFPGTPPRLIDGGKPPAGTQHPLAAGATWRDPQTLELTWRFIETPHHDTVTFHFEDGKVRVSFASSIAKGKDKRPVLEGTATA